MAPDFAEQMGNCGPSSRPPSAALPQSLRAFASKRPERVIPSPMRTILQLQRSIGALAATCLAASCVSNGALLPTAPPTRGESASTASQIIHYIRRDLDGAEAEHVYVYRPRPDHVEVYKMRERCTNAALVVAEIDTERDEARTIVGGRLRRDGTQHAFAFLALDPITRVLSVRAELPDQVITESVTIGSERLWLYDFDFADLAPPDPTQGGRLNAASLALLWPDGGEDGFLRHEGRADFTYAGPERRNGRDVLRYRVSGEAFVDDAGGDLWIDSQSGFIIEAILGKPNHPGYRGLVLRLEDVQEANDASWRHLLQSHFAGCPNS